jgi:hypothetical protein
VITATHASWFGDAWPAVNSRLLRTLRSEGVAHQQAEDLVQEAALRALDHEVQYASSDELFAWCLVVARRIRIDGFRRARFVADAGVPETGSAPSSVEDAVEQRLLLEEVARVLPRLSDGERQALMSTPDGAQLERREAVRQNVRRHRARRHVLTMLEGMIGVLVALVARWRRVTKQAMTLVAGSAIGIAATFTVVPGPWSDNDGGGAPEGDARRAAVVSAVHPAPGVPLPVLSVHRSAIHVVSRHDDRPASAGEVPPAPVPLVQVDAPVNDSGTRVRPKGTAAGMVCAQSSELGLDRTCVGGDVEIDGPPDLLPMASPTG